MKTILLLSLLTLARTSAFQLALFARGVSVSQWHQATTDTTRTPRRRLFAFPTISKIRQEWPLFTSSSDEAEDKESSPLSDDDAMQTKVAGRKKRVAIGNRIVSVGYLAWTLTSLVAFLKTSNNDIVTALVSIDPGPLLAAGFAYILIGACQNDRLSSDTYKRLNLMLATFGFVGLLVGQNRGELWIITSVIAMINSIKGYGYGIKGWKLTESVSPIVDMMEGCKANVKCLLRVPNERSVGYLLATLFVGSVPLCMLKSGIKLSVVSYTTLAMLAATTLTLKDAADRGRLEGTTFIELNAMTATVFAQLSGASCIQCLLCIYADMHPVCILALTIGSSFGSISVQSSLSALWSRCGGNFAIFSTGGGIIV
jgi:hypothetical protein